ncbi:Na+/H+ antiporter subunit E [Phytoactinopolyspora alkaliphila]|uniref:Na+/H+ antiporter subunit E n=1 Tax=Phytoactinopolyspora alkaliphila TaxID=1783498 RepID=A0A6N9YLH0_9ACTN|nr:Na+/H+ antiporter subunit E [Phytoactinopolyspora alkaliphila]NED95805.1 Na+/H+ antiporter subunit E [Phytoactinopolyspora alkaliphila]
MNNVLRRFGAELARAGRLVYFGGYFSYQLVVASLEVAWDVLTPRSRLQPGIVALPLASRTPVEMTLLTNLVSLTPGTLTVTVNRDPGVLYVHGMYAEDPEAFRKELSTFERRMLAAVRLKDRHVPNGEVS